jgi:hypothetical protein
MLPSDWKNPHLRAIGRRYATEARNLAEELADYGADAGRLLITQRYVPADVSLPGPMADALMALCLALSGDEQGQPDAAFGANVVRLKPRPVSADGGDWRSAPVRPDPSDAA